MECVLYFRKIFGKIKQNPDKLWKCRFFANTFSMCQQKQFFVLFLTRQFTLIVRNEINKGCFIRSWMYKQKHFKHTNRIFYYHHGYTDLSSWRVTYHINWNTDSKEGKKSQIFMCAYESADNRFVYFLKCCIEAL